MKPQDRTRAVIVASDAETVYTDAMILSLLAETLDMPPTTAPSDLLAEVARLRRRVARGAAASAAWLAAHPERAREINREAQRRRRERIKAQLVPA